MSPRFQFCIALICTLFAGWALQRILTQSAPSAASESATTRTDDGASAVTLSVRFTGTPISLRVLCGDTLIAEKPNGETSPWEEEITFPLGANSAELHVIATWADAVPHAVTLELIPPARDAREMTRWNDTKTLNDIYTFTW